MTTYPTAANLTPKTIGFVAKTLGSSFTSPFTGQTQTVRYSGQYWELDLQYPPLSQTAAETLWGFFNQLGGTDGTFYYVLPARFLMSGSLAITVTGDGNTFTGATGQVGKFGGTSDRLVQFTGTGSIFPRLPTGSYTVSAATPALMRMGSNELAVNVDEMREYGLAAGIREAI